MEDRRKYALAGMAALLSAGTAIWWNARTVPAPQDHVQRADLPGHDTLKVAPAQARAMGLRLAPAVRAEEIPVADLPAIVAPPANARVAVTATLPGVVIRTMVVEGDLVRRGQALAIVSSRDVLSLHADLARASSRLQVAQTNARRLAQFGREGIIAEARSDEANALAAEARTDVSEKSRILKLVNGNGASGTYTIFAPISGRVTRASIQAGAPVDGASAPYVIDAPGKFEVNAQLPERLIGQVRPGMTVRLGALHGSVTAVGSTIDPATRSVLVKANLPPGADAVSGRAASMSLFGPAPANAVSVPSAAVTRLGGRDVVFVPVPEGYRPRPVTTGGTIGGTTIVLSGLRAGEQVVSSGASALKSLAQAR